MTAAQWWYGALLALVAVLYHDRLPGLRYVLTPVVGIALALISIPGALIGMTLFVWLIKWDAQPTQMIVRWGTPPQYRSMILGDLPPLLRWWQTPDVRFPCAADEMTMTAMLDAKGQTYTAWWWGAIRNQMMGLSAACGKPTTDYAPEGMGFWSRGDIWRYALPAGYLKIVLGWQVIKRLDGSFWAVPLFTAKIRN